MQTSNPSKFQLFSSVMFYFLYFEPVLLQNGALGLRVLSCDPWNRPPKSPPPRLRSAPSTHYKSDLTSSLKTRET